MGDVAEPANAAERRAGGGVDTNIFELNLITAIERAPRLAGALK